MGWMRSSLSKSVRPRITSRVALGHERGPDGDAWGVCAVAAVA
jgi:hypothetical protein